MRCGCIIEKETIKISSINFLPQLIKYTTIFLPKIINEIRKNNKSSLDHTKSSSSRQSQLPLTTSNRSVVIVYKC